MTFNSAIPDSPTSEAFITVSLINTGHVEAQRTNIVDPCKPEKIDLPVFAFLLEKAGKSYLFDLGLRPDLHAIPTHVQDIEYHDFPPHAGDTLPAILPADVTLETAFISHYHWDHIGNPGLLVKGTPVVLGKGSVEAIGSGYPDGDPWIDHDWLEHCDFQELEFDSGPLGDFPRSKDWFGDGSLWFIDCPGHCAGNMMALVRVSACPDRYVLLGGDCCHDQALYTFPCSHNIPNFTNHQGHVITMHEHPSIAKKNMERLNKMSKRDNIMVLLAHEREAVGIIPCLTLSGENRGSLNSWYEMGWKEKKFVKYA